MVPNSDDAVGKLREDSPNSASNAAAGGTRLAGSEGPKSVTAAGIVSMRCEWCLCNYVCEYTCVWVSMG